MTGDIDMDDPDTQEIGERPPTARKPKRCANRPEKGGLRFECFLPPPSTASRAT